VLSYVLFVSGVLLYYCHGVSNPLKLTNISISIKMLLISTYS